MNFIVKIDNHLVRLGGAGAVLPFLFVVRRICTLTLLPPAEKVDNLEDVEPGSSNERRNRTKQKYKLIDYYSHNS